MFMQSFISSSGGGSYAVGANGEVSSVADSLKSECGNDFDEYVRRALQEAFPYSSTMPASRNVTNLWSDRRFRLYEKKDSFREGKVVSWEQSNTGPFCPVTFWDLNVEMDSFGPGDTVLIDGLVSAKQHNGKQGEIIKFLQDPGRYRVKLDRDDNNFIAVKPQNLKTAVTSFRVNRMNIEGGGTLLRAYSLYGERSKHLISLEWLEPASPTIDLDEGALKANCPTCRAVEPPLAAYDNDPEKMEKECPICMEIKQCRILNCEHEVCTDCWSKWRNTSTGVPIAAPQIDPDQLKKEREENFQEAYLIASHTLGGNATKSGDNDETVNEAERQVMMYCSDVSKSLLEADRSGEQGLVRFWRQLKTVAVHYLCIQETFVFLLGNVSIPALEILFQVFEERLEEIVGFYMTVSTSEIQARSVIVPGRLSDCCSRIGEHYEEVENYRGAIPWYERALALSKQTYQICKDEAGQRGLAIAHCNLGLAQKYAGFLSLALESYDASLKYASAAAENRRTLLREMKEWTGSSGKLTPGC